MSRISTSRTSDLTIPFVLTEGSLKKLDEALGRFADKVAYRVDCADELQRELDLKKLLAFENAPKKAITTITADATKEGDNLRGAIVRLRQSSFRATIILVFRGPESEVEKLSDAVESILAGMRPWYWWLAKHPFVNLVLAVPLPLMVVMYSLEVWWNRIGRSQITFRGGALAGLVILGAALLNTAAIFALVWFTSKLFPRATFAIGQGLSRYNVLEKIRWTIVIGFFVSLAAGVAVLVVQR